LKSKIEKLAQIETENLDCLSPTDYHEQFSTKSIDESKASRQSVYFTPNDGHLSPQSSQMSPIHVNYLNEEGAAGGCDIDDARGGGWKSAVILRNAVRANHNPVQRNSFVLPTDYLDEADEGNFIIPDPIYADIPKDDFHDVLDDDAPFNEPFNRLRDAESMSSLSSVPNDTINRRRKRKKYREKENPKSTYSIENEAFLLQEMHMDVSTGARRKIRYHDGDMPSASSASSSQCSSRKESKGN
jgi:hypothetical protein